ncbi:hypothetical protein HU200_007940 [Digitaria exilis]|uniref:SIAH-type domain-containing protein n=1 Tax=Digitaria exilis TaxID=1010633 RepID=A0A835KS34_9POAL|nr:hypothetical protein HU200_007940 [Digitaria exilis]
MEHIVVGSSLLASHIGIQLKNDNLMQSVPRLQCDVGHVVCSPCRDKLEDTGKCHVCRGATGGFRRCHAMDRVVESARVVCPNAAYGCTERPSYYDQQCHRQMCLYPPWQCPGEDCSFMGSMEDLLQHFAGVHGWPCSTKVRTEEMSNIRLKDGFNFILLDGEKGDTANAYRNSCLFLLDVVRQPLSRAISVILIDLHAAVDGQRLCLKKMKCELAYSRHLFSSSRPRSDLLTEHAQTSRFIVTCTDLSNGHLPDPEERFQFVVPNFVLAHDEKYAVNVGFRIQVVSGFGTS